MTKVLIALEYGRNELEYCRNSLSVMLPTVCNKILTHIINENNEFRRKKLLKTYFFFVHNELINFCNILGPPSNVFFN